MDKNKKPKRYQWQKLFTTTMNNNIFWNHAWHNAGKYSYYDLFLFLNKKVLLRERKRHTARCVASARFADWGGNTPSNLG